MLGSTLTLCQSRLNHLPESTLIYARVDFIPQSVTLNLASEVDTFFAGRSVLRFQEPNLLVGCLEELVGGLVAVDGVLLGGGVPVGRVVEPVLHRGVPDHDSQQVSVNRRPASQAQKDFRLIESNAKCLYLKNLPCKGTLRQVFICLRSSPLLGFCLGGKAIL
jgi:hypothetical protein